MLTKVVLGIESLVFCSNCPGKTLVCVGLDQGLLGCTVGGKHQLKVFMAAEVHGLEGVRKETSSQLGLVAQNRLGR